MLTSGILIFLVHHGLCQMCPDEAGRQLSEYKEAHPNPSVLTTAFGRTVPSLTALLTVGRYGPLLFQDNIFFDEITNFDRERIPERVVHAKGAGAFGYLEITHDITNYSKAVVFEKIGKRTPLFARFSTVIGELGSADTVREPRGYALKFQTEDGIWDLLGLNTPVFFIRDPMLYPSLIHCQKKNPVTKLNNPEQTWDFFTLRPETINQVLYVNSDIGIPDGYRHMDGHPINTFKLVNARGDAVWCKFHYETNQKLKSLTSKEGQRIAGEDPDYGTRDLYNAIRRGDYPSWTLSIQVMSMEEAKTYRFDPFDATKIWPRNLFPFLPIGKIVLNKNPTNFFAQVEQVGFAPDRMIPGIEPSPDRTLQARLFNYGDTQRHRLGPNFLQLPINRPTKVPVKNEERDGAACYFNQDGAPNFFPNSFNGPRPNPAAKIKPFEVHGIADRYDSGDDHNFEQPAELWNSLDAGERSRIIENIATSLGPVSRFIQIRAIKILSQVNPELSQGVSQRLPSCNSTASS